MTCFFNRVDEGLRRGICEPFGCPRTAARLMVLKGIMLFIVGGVLAWSNMHAFSSDFSLFVSHFSTIIPIENNYKPK